MRPRKRHNTSTWIVFAFVLIPIVLLSAPVRGSQKEIASWLDERVATGEVSAASAVWILRRGTEFVIAGQGVQEATQFQIGSVTKPFTNLLLAEMVSSGDVTYETTIGEILGDDFQPGNAGLRGITLLQLATHSSGLPRLPANLNPAGNDPYAEYGASELMAGLEITRAQQPLGDFYSYSNFGAGLLGHLLGRVDGRGYFAALGARVLEPLGLGATGPAPQGDVAEAFTGGQKVPAWTFRDSLAGAGALWSTTGDLAKVAQIYLGGDSGLRHASAKDLEIVKRAEPYSVTRVWHRCETSRGPVVWHNGRTAGHGSFLGFSPDTGEGVAILVAGDADVTSFGLKLLGYDSSAPNPSEEEARPIDERLFGQYRMTPAFGLGVFADQGVLKIQATGQSGFELHPVSDGWYALGEVDASLHFVSESSKIVAVELAQGGRVQRAEKVADVADVASRQEISLDREALVEYEGTFILAPGAVFTLRMGDEGLEARLTGQPFFPI
ncbi:MAG: beta-lactamase family protein, partial [Thermoanaerobaculia bacterium]|nr:beta-lactamase family protein [Thermoanaerobaculia bacterium]